MGLCWLYFRSFNQGFLKVVSATFLIVCFLSVKEGTCETWKNLFYFTSKALFVLEQIKFQNCRYLSFMTSSNAQAQNKKYILLNNLRRKQSVNELRPVYVISQKKKIYQKHPRKLLPKNQFQTPLSLQRIKRNLYWKMKLLKQGTYTKYVLAKLSKFVQISTQTSSDSFLQRII